MLKAQKIFGDVLVPAICNTSAHYVKIHQNMRDTLYCDKNAADVVTPQNGLIHLSIHSSFLLPLLNNKIWK